MNSIMFLKAAYICAWVIYLGYLGRILLRMKKVQAERGELERTHIASRAVVEPPAAAAKR